MGISANGENLKLGRGAIFVAEYDTNGDVEAEYSFLGNVTSLELTSENESREKYSSTEQSSPLLDQRVIRQKYNLAAACDEHTLKNLQLFMSGTTTTRSQALDTSNTVTLTAVVAGKWYDLGFQGITGATVHTGSVLHVSGTDYTLDARSGMLYITPGGGAVGDTITVAFGVPAVAYDVIRGGKRVSPAVKVLFLADDANAEGVAAGDRLTVWKATAAPDGAYNFIGDDYSSFSLQFAVLSDSVNHPDEPFFLLERAQ